MTSGNIAPSYPESIELAGAEVADGLERESNLDVFFRAQRTILQFRPHIDQFKPRALIFEGDAVFLPSIQIGLDISQLTEEDRVLAGHLDVAA